MPLLIAAFIVFSPAAFAGETAAGEVLANPQLTAEAFILLEGSSGQIICEKNAFQQRPPASTTKMVTALLALERGSLTDPVQIGPRALRTGGSTLGLKTGQVYPLGELVEGALIRSGNDACVAIGEHIGGNEPGFIQMMNQKALALGARNTFFCNTNGMPDPGHYSSCYDLALIARYALRNPEFARIVKTQYETISMAPDEGASDNAEASGFMVKNTNALLWSFPGADGVKTGTTNAAGACLVASATREDRQLIAVVLKSRNRFGDAAKLLEFGFNNFTEIKVAEPGDQLAVLPFLNGNPASIATYSSERLGVTVPKHLAAQVQIHHILHENIAAPLPAGTEVGESLITNQGQILQRAPLYNSQAVAKLEPWWKFWRKV